MSEAVTTLATVPDARAVTVLETRPDGSIVTHDDWRGAIAQYDADVAAGRIQFNDSGFADSYPGQARTDAEVTAFILSNVEPF